jgi:rhamnose transport system permease protein
VLLIGTLGSALRLAGVTSDIINIITGVLLVLSVVSASLLAWLRRRRISAIGKKKEREMAAASPS